MKQGNNRFFQCSTSDFVIDSIKGSEEAGFSTIVGTPECSSATEICTKVTTCTDPLQSVAINSTHGLSNRCQNLIHIDLAALTRISSSSSSR